MSVNFCDGASERTHDNSHWLEAPLPNVMDVLMNDEQATTLTSYQAPLTSVSCFHCIPTAVVRPYSAFVPRKTTQDDFTTR